MDIFGAFFAALTIGPAITGLIGIGQRLLCGTKKRKLEKKIEEFRKKINV